MSSYYILGKALSTLHNVVRHLIPPTHLEAGISTGVSFWVVAAAERDQAEHTWCEQNSEVEIPGSNASLLIGWTSTLRKLLDIPLCGFLPVRQQ